MNKLASANANKLSSINWNNSTLINGSKKDSIVIYIDNRVSKTDNQEDHIENQILTKLSQSPNIKRRLIKTKSNKFTKSISLM